MASPTQKDIDYLVSNPKVWRKFETTFGSLPPGFSKPAPGQDDYEYLRENPQMADKFVETFGEESLKAFPPTTREQALGPEPIEQEPQDRPVGARALFGAFKDAYDQNGLTGVRDFLFSAPDPQLVQDFLQAGQVDDDTFASQYRNFQGDAGLAVMRSTARLGEGISFLPEATLKYMGFDSAAEVPGALRERFAEAEKEFVTAMSPEARRAIETQLVQRADDGSLEFGEGGKDPHWWMLNGIDMAVMMAPGIGAAGKASRMAYGAAYAKTLAKAGAAKAPTSVAIRAAEMAGKKAAFRAAYIAGGLGEALPASGMAGSQIDNTIKSLDEETLLSYDPYRELRDQGVSHEAARAKVANDQAVKGALAVAVVTGVTGYPLARLISRFAETGGIAKTAAGAAAKGFAVEGGQEFVQEGSQQLIQNWAEKPITNIDPWEGVLESAITGAVLGGALGGATGAAAGGDKPGQEKGDPQRSPVVRKTLRDYNAAREELFAATSAAKDPDIQISKADIDGARQRYQETSVALGEALLASGRLSAEDQVKVASSLEEAKASGIKGLQDGDVKGVVRTTDEAGAPQGDAGQPAGQKEPAAAKEAETQPALSEVETSRLAALDKVANADNLSADEFQPLVKAGLAKMLPSGVAMLLPAGKRARQELAKRMADAEAAEATEKPVAKSKPTKAEPSKEPAKAAPATAAAKPEPKSAPLAPGYSDTDVVKPGEKAKPVPYEPRSLETTALSPDDYSALDRFESGKDVTPDEMTNLVKTGLVASRDGGKKFVMRPAGKREIKAYRESGRQTAVERDLQGDIGITGATLRLSAEARREGRKARAEAVEASEQVNRVFEESKAEMGARAAAEIEKMAADQERELAAEKDKDWDRAKDEVGLDEYETLSVLFDEEQRSSLSGSIRGILKQVDAKARRREAAARGRLKVLMSDTKAYDVGGAVVEGSKVWKEIVDIGAMKIIQGVVRIPDWNAAMKITLKKSWKQIAPNIDKIYKQAREMASNPLGLLEIKHSKKLGDKQKLRGQPEGKGLDVLRRQIEALRVEGEPYRFWYEESSKAILQVTHGNVADARKLAGLLAIYSSKTSVGPNTGNAMKAWYQYKSGQKIVSGQLTSQDKDARRWLETGEFPVGTKRSNFYVNLMREIDPSEFDGFQGATVDLWMMRAFGYFAEAPGDPQYAFVATEVQRIARETGWEPQQVQAAVWVAAKARYEHTEKAAKAEAVRRKYIRMVPGPKGKDIIDIIDARRYNRLRRDYALRSLFPKDHAKKAGSDYSRELNERMAQINWESRPSTTSGLIPGIHSEPNPARIAEYHEAIARALQDETGSDIIARRLGMLVLGQVDGPSAWYYNRDDYFRFTHYSKRLKDPYVTLDISKFGTGVAMTAQEKSRGPRIFLYPEGAEVAENAMTGSVEYTVEVLKDDMYDFTADPMEFRKGRTFDQAEDLIKAAGFRGYFVKDHADAILRGQARLFGSHPAVRSDVASTFRGYVGSGTALRIGAPRAHLDAQRKDAKTNPKTEEGARKKMTAYSAILGHILKQDAVSWFAPYYTDNVGGSNGVDIEIGRAITPSEAGALYRETVRLVGERGITKDSVLHHFAPIQHPGGAYFMNFTGFESEAGDRISNTDFHKIIRAAVDKVFGGEGYLSKQDLTDVVFTRFASDGEMVENNWKENRDGEDYRRRAEAAGEREAFDWAVSVLAPKIAKINKDFARRYGWDRSPERAKESLKSGLSQRLEGQPESVTGRDGSITPVSPSVRLRLVAQAYMREAGLKYTPPQDFVPMDEALARRVAAAYDAMKHDPKNAEVRASYAAMAAETLAQWEWIKKSGLKVDVIPSGAPDPYEGNPRNAIADITENNHFWLFPTASGLGNEIFGDTPKDHPILAKTGEKIGDHELLVNDVFRIVHDVFGHAKDGIGFRANGEYNAWRQHAAMYTPLARRAMSAETLGQNSWLNHGPFGDRNRNARVEDTVFAEQKAGLLPEEFTNDDSVMFAPAEGAGAGMTVADVEAAIADVRKEIGMPIRVVKTFADLPQHIQNWAKQRDVDPAGVFAPRIGTMYIVADKMKSSFEAVETYAHEVVGHYGLRGVLGDRFKTVMGALAKQFPVELRKAAVAQKIKLDSEAHTLEAAEEMVAFAAGLAFRGTGRLPARSVYRRIVDAARGMMLERGFLKTWTQRDIDALIARSADFVKSGRAKRARAQRDIARKMGKEPGKLRTEFSGDSSFPNRVRPGTGFAEWFRGSKAVTKDGMPRVFYHGTTRAFGSFRVGAQRRGSDGFRSRKAGLFFAENPLYANEFTYGGGRVIPVYLSTQNPIDLTKGFAGLPADVRESLREHMDTDGLSLDYHDAIDPAKMWTAFDADYGFGADLVGVLTRAGYDGAILSEGGGTFVVFSPNQVKSIFNRGEYSLFNDDMMASAGEAPIYYSAVARAVEALRMNKARGHQWLAAIKSSPGVKAEEVEWLFLGDYLQENETFTKEQVLRYIDLNKIEVIPSEVTPRYNRDQLVTAAVRDYKEILFFLEPSGELSANPEETSAVNRDLSASLRNLHRWEDPHWEKHGTVASARIGTVKADGRKIMVVDEIQSDLHQRGREGGYAARRTVWKVFMRASGMPRHAESWADVDQNQYPRIGDDAFGVPLEPYDVEYDTKEAAEAVADSWMERSPEQAALIHVLPVNPEPSRMQVPDAPFKNNGWLDLVIKRLLRLAVDGGYDAIQFTSGKVQRERYRLSAMVDRIEYSPDGPESYRLIGSRGDETLFDRSVDTADLAGFVGKGLADRIVSDTFEDRKVDTTGWSVNGREDRGWAPWVFDAAGRPLVEATGLEEGEAIEMASSIRPVGSFIEGKDLDVGGLGLGAFYDDIVTKAFNRITKKMGGRVQAAELRSDAGGNNAIDDSFMIEFTGNTVDGDFAIGVYDYGDMELQSPIHKIPVTIPDDWNIRDRNAVERLRNFRMAARVQMDLWIRSQMRQPVTFKFDFKDVGHGVLSRQVGNGLWEVVKTFKADPSGRIARHVDHQLEYEAFQYARSLPGALGIEKRFNQDAGRAFWTNERMLQVFAPKVEPFWELKITPEMQSIIPGGMPMFAPSTGNPFLDGFLSKIGEPHIPFREKLQRFTTGLGDRMRQQILDHFHGIARTGDIEGYMAARLSTGTAGLMRAIMEWGHPVWDGGLHGVEGDYGFLDILKPLGSDVEKWAAWMVAKRADRLMSEGRENLFTQEEIDAAIAMGNGRQDFEQASRLYAEFKKKILDFAEESGIIDPETRPLWENDDHIPFYRVMEDGLLKGATAGKGLGFVKKQIVKLKGGTQNIGDPIENILRNWTALIEASVQAQAARTVIDNLDGSGLVVKIPEPVMANQLNTQALQALLTQAQINPNLMTPAAQMGLLALSQPAANKDGVITIWRNGKRERWQVHDQMLYKSMQSISPEVWSSWMNVLRVPKRVLTKTITVVPLFIARNFWRDIWSAFTIGTTDKRTIPFVPVIDNLKGMAGMIRRTDTAKTLIASGAGFVGTGFNPTDAAAEAVSLAKDVRLGHRFWHSPILLYKAYMRFSEAAENASRVAIYESSLKGGADKMAAAFEAKDVMDFSLRGSSPVVRFLIETVPFWGARTQGLYKLGRAIGGNPGGVFLRGMLLTMGTLAMFMRNFDDERYKELTLDQKNLSWHAWDVFEKGDHWIIPKPFEVGTIFGTVPEAFLDAFITNAAEPDKAKMSLQVVSHAFTQALDLKPEIAAVWPMVELALNENTFTQAPILNAGDQGVLPQEQDSPFVRSTYRLLAHSMPEIAPEALRSPKQLQHLARGYIGSLQDWVLFGTDIVARSIAGEPPPPAKAASEPLFVGGFRRTGPARQTRQLNEMYKIAEEASKIDRSITKLSEQEQSPPVERRIEQLITENEFKLGVQSTFADGVKQIGEARKAQRAIQLDREMTPEEKRAEIEAIQDQINEMARELWQIRPGGPMEVETVSKLTGVGKNAQAAILRRDGFRLTSSLVDDMPERPSRAMAAAFKDMEMRA